MFRRRQAREQGKMGIGKSMWRREKDGVSQREKRRDNIMSQIREKASELGANAAEAEVHAALPRVEPGMQQKRREDLDKIAEEAQRVLDAVKSQKKALDKQDRQAKKGRKKRKLTEGTYDDPRNWRSMM